MVKQVGPAQGEPTTNLAFEAVSSIGFPARGLRHGPRSQGTSAKRPEIRLQSAPLHLQMPSREQRQERNVHGPPSCSAYGRASSRSPPKGARPGRGYAPAPRSPPRTTYLFLWTEESRYPLLGGSSLSSPRPRDAVPAGTPHRRPELLLECHGHSHWGIRRASSAHCCT